MRRNGWHLSLRSRASRGTPSTAVRNGSLPEFPRPRSRMTVVPWSVPAFLSRTPGGAAPLRLSTLRDECDPVHFQQAAPPELGIPHPLQGEGGVRAVIS